MAHEIDPIVLQKAEKWLHGNFDESTKTKIRFLLENDTKELTDAFYKDLEFGTGGLRGIMGVGTNRMNKYTVAMATQGLANYLIKMFFCCKEKIKVAIAYDSRNNSKYFAEIASEVLSANGLIVYLFDSLRPTPELSFAIRQLNCHSGIVITASHNPKEYNGYKVYWNDGGQLVAPHDHGVISEVQKISTIDEVKFEKHSESIHIIGDEIDNIYISRILSLSLSPEIIKKNHNLSIVYTPIHGTGYKLIPRALNEFGFTNVLVLESQKEPDGDFSTVKSPNPEEHATLELAIQKAKQTNADLVMATDPDGDRVGIAVKNDKNEFILLNGNQTASLLIYYLLTKWEEIGKIKGHEYIVKTIVTSELLKEIAIKNKVGYFDVLTGFKYIAEIIQKQGKSKTFIAGGEESYGYLVGDFVRDKDAVISCCMIAETAAWAREQGKSMYELLKDIYAEFGFYKETLLSVTKKGKEGLEEIQQMMNQYRNNPMTSINNLKVIMIKDYELSICSDVLSGKKSKIELPKSNVLQFFLSDGSKITIRPSGTEPKIKFYFGIKSEMPNRESYEQINEESEVKIQQIIKELKLV